MSVWQPFNIHRCVQNMGFSRRKLQYCGLTRPFASSSDFCYNKWDLWFKILAWVRLFHNFCTIVKERDETRTKYRRIINQFSRDQLLFIDESAKRWRDFSDKYQYNQLCKRENILRNLICVGPIFSKNTKSFASLQDRQEKSCRHAIYGMIDGSRNTIFSWWKIPNGRVKLKTVVIYRFVWRSDRQASLTDWPAVYLTDQFTDWLTDLLIDRLTDQLIHQLNFLTNRLLGWLTDWPTD